MAEISGVDISLINIFIQGTEVVVRFTLDINITRRIYNQLIVRIAESRFRIILSSGYAISNITDIQNNIRSFALNRQTAQAEQAQAQQAQAQAPATSRQREVETNNRNNQSEMERFLRSFRDTQNGDRDMSQRVFQIGARGQSSVYAPYMRVG